MPLTSTMPRRRSTRLVALVAAVLAGTGCTNLSHATRYAAGRVRDSIRDDFRGGHYVAGTAHALLAPLSFTAVLIGDPGARTPPERPASEARGSQAGR